MRRAGEDQDDKGQQSGTADSVRPSADRLVCDAREVQGGEEHRGDSAGGQTMPHRSPNASNTLHAQEAERSDPDDVQRKCRERRRPKRRQVVEIPAGPKQHFAAGLAEEERRQRETRDHVEREYPARPSLATGRDSR
jgi:hypothetical protein